MSERAAAFLALHTGPGFIIPNTWDAGSARILERIGFAAIATTSAGIAWSFGVPDGGVMTRDRMLARTAEIVDAVALPVSVDLESGYGDVAGTVAQALALGAVGGNIEDAEGGALVDIDEATDRIAAARDTAPRGTFVVNARTDPYFARGAEDPFAETIRRAHRYLEAGADCIFVPGVNDEETIGRLVAEIAAPLNIVAGLSAHVIDVPTLFSLGVKRVSLGGSLARVAYSALEHAAQELSTTGTLGFLDGVMPYADLQRRLTR